MNQNQTPKKAELKILRSILSCYSFAQLKACRDWLERIHWAGMSPEFFEFAIADQAKKVKKNGLDF